MTFSASRCLDFSAVYIVTCVILYTLFCIIWSSTTIVLLLPAKYITFVHPVSVTKVHKGTLFGLDICCEGGNLLLLCTSRL
jgi:hypothetical protein